MFDRYGETVRLTVEAVSGDVASLVGYQPFSAGHIAAAATAELRGKVALVRGVHNIDSETQVGLSECVVFSADLGAAEAILVPPLASALAVWESLHLELGDAAVWTTGAPLSDLIGQAALWRGAATSIALGDTASMAAELAVPHTERVDWSDQDSAAARFEKLIAGRPGFAGVDLSGRADVIDIFLEVIPRFGRLLLAGPAGDPVTIDFYKNVHRKGIVLAATTVEPALVFDSVGGADTRAQLGRAAAIVRNPKMALKCRRLLGAAQFRVGVSLGR